MVAIAERPVVVTREAGAELRPLTKRLPYGPTGLPVSRFGRPVSRARASAPAPAPPVRRAEAPAITGRGSFGRACASC